MKANFADKYLIADYMGCFGNFNLDDPICNRHCAICIRCAIERDQNTRMEILHDLASYDELFLKIQ